MSTRRQALQGARALAVATLVAKVSGFGGQLVLARLLVPEQFGRFAFALSLVTLLGTVANYECRRDILRDPTRAARRARAYTIVQGLTGVIVAVLLWSSGDAIAERCGRLAEWFGARPAGDGGAAGDLLTALCLVPLLESVRVPAVALLEERLRFGVAARVECVAALLQVGVALALAAAGAGAWALVAGFYTGSLARTVGGLCFEGARILAARCARADLFAVFAFGGPLLLANLLAAWYWKIDAVMVGAALGMAAAGLYAIAFEIPRALFQLTEVLSRVGLSVLGRCDGDTAIQARVFSTSVRASFALLAPAVVVGSVHGELLLRVLFGERWAAAAPAFEILLVLVLLRGSLRFWGDVATTRGRPELLTRAALAAAVALPLFGAFFLRWGILGMALAALMAWVLPAPFCLAWVRRELGIRFGTLLGPGFLALVGGLGSGFFLVHGCGLAGEMARAGVVGIQLLVFALLLLRTDRELVGLFWEALRRPGEVRP